MIVELLFNFIKIPASSQSVHVVSVRVVRNYIKFGIALLDYTA